MSQIGQPGPVTGQGNSAEAGARKENYLDAGSETTLIVGQASRGKEGSLWQGRRREINSNRPGGQWVGA